MFFMLSGTASVWSQAKRLDLSIGPNSPLLLKVASAKMLQKASSSASTSANDLGAKIEQADARLAAEAAVERSVDQVVLTRIGSGCYFGEVALVLATGKRCATVHARTALVCYTISESDLRHTLRDLPGVSEYVHLIARRRLERCGHF